MSSSRGKDRLMQVEAAAKHFGVEESRLAQAVRDGQVLTLRKRGQRLIPLNELRQKRLLS